MKYIRQICVIFIFSLLGELCHAVIPLSLPASVYGMILLFAAIKLKVVPVEKVREAGSFLVALLPLIFVVPAVGLLEYWPVIAGNVIAFGCMIVFSLIITFAVSGLITQIFMRSKVRYTRMVIENSFLELLQDKPVSRITVTEICRRSCINRATGAVTRDFAKTKVK